MRANKSGPKTKTEKPERSHWRRYLLAGALVCAAVVGTISSKTCDRQKADLLAKRNAARELAAKTERLARLSRWRQQVQRAILRKGHAGFPKPDPLVEMIEHDFPYGSLDCELLLKPKNETLSEEPSGYENRFISGMQSVGDQIERTGKAMELFVRDPEDLFRDSCLNEIDCEPNLVEEVDYLSASGNVGDLIRLINSVNNLGIQWSEYGSPGDIFLAYVANIAEAEGSGLQVEVDWRCLSRVAYAVTVLDKAQTALAELVLESPGSLNRIISALHDDSKPGFIKNLAFSVLSDDSQADSVRTIFASLSEDSKQMFLLLFSEYPFLGNVGILKELATRADPRLRKAAQHALDGYMEDSEIE